MTSSSSSYSSSTSYSSSSPSTPCFFFIPTSSFISFLVYFFLQIHLFTFQTCFCYGFYRNYELYDYTAMIDSIGLFDYFCAKEDSKARVDKDPVELEGIVEEEEEPGGN